MVDCKSIFAFTRPSNSAMSKELQPASFGSTFFTISKTSDEVTMMARRCRWEVWPWLGSNWSGLGRVPLCFLAMLLGRETPSLCGCGNHLCYWGKNLNSTAGSEDAAGTWPEVPWRACAARDPSAWPPGLFPLVPSFLRGFLPVSSPVAGFERRRVPRSLLAHPFCLKHLRSWRRCDFAGGGPLTAGCGLRDCYGGLSGDHHLKALDGRGILHTVILSEFHWCTLMCRTSVKFGT